MEAFEPIRDLAVRLHTELVSAGADPFKPLALVEAAIRKLELELVWLEPGNAALKGAKALFDDQSGTVICEDTGEPGDRAQLVAHEIGHACIHTSSASCVGRDIDPSRPTEAAPVGLQRVEDYGAHERRELQANVFAREFLFPRPVARRFHLDEALTATEIVARTGLSKHLVRQQIFDTLLLPPPPAPMVVGVPHPSRPDPSQERAAAHRGSPFQLQAGPGTGKTRTLIKRINSLFDEGVDPSAVLVLTFSNRAAGELAERLAATVPIAASHIWIGTFHAFGLDLVRRHHEVLGLSSDPPLFDRSDAIEVLEEILPTLPLVHYRNLWDPAMILREIVAAISRAKDEMTDPARYRLLAQAMLDRARDDDARVAAEKCLEVAHVYELYERALRDYGGVDFGDLIMRPTLLLESDPALRAMVQLRHRHVLVDEYQDVNRASGRLLRALAGDGKRLWVVGDSRQAIYRFRGASAANMALFSAEYENAAVDKLAINYRSSSQIVRTFQAAAPHMGASKGMLPLSLTADRGSGPGIPEIRVFHSLDDEEAGIAASIREIEKSGVRLRDQAVLCRSNKRLNEIAAALEARGIPVLHLGSLFEREEVRDLLSLLSLAIDRFGGGLARIGAMPRYNLSLQDVYLVTRRLRESEHRVLDILPGLASTPGLTQQGIKGLELLARDLDGLISSSSAWEYLSTYLLDRSGLVRDLAQREPIADRMRAVAIWQFLNFVREESPARSGFPIRRTLDRVRQLVLLAEERDLRQVPAAAIHMDAVRLMTVHGSKGLEFEAVHIPGLTVSSFPTSTRGQRCPPPVGMVAGAESLSIAEESKLAQEHEEQCLFFVALSRACMYLRLYRTRFQDNGNKRSPSPFLAWGAATAQRIDDPAALPLPQGVLRLTPITVSRTSASDITDSKLGLYEKCPRRYFYTHILGLGGARKATAFSRTHDCLYELIDWLADTRRVANPSIADAERAFEEMWQARGPKDHGFAADYRRLASRLVSALIRSGAGQRFREAKPLAIDFPNGRVIVEPDEMADLPDGTVILRRVRTGQKRSDEYDRLDYTLYQLAGESHFGSGFRLQALHLTDEILEPVEITARKLQNRRVSSDQMLRSISSGLFPTEVDSVSCPRCPHFFVCAAAPKGGLTLP